MSRKDYCKFASMFNELLQGEGLKYYTAEHVFEAIVKATADILQNDNNRFNRERFLDAVFKGVSTGYNPAKERE